jgi:alkylhydroperoxidase/carboxymuconolactone decarboxylase family protein
MLQSRVKSRDKLRHPSSGFITTATCAGQNEKEFSMAHQYYESADLADFPNIGEFARDQGKAFFDYYGRSTGAGKLTEREKSLIAIAVAHTEHCPYCIDAFTTKCLSLGLTSDEMMEAVHVGASMVAGAVVAHATQMRKIIRKNEM